MTRRQAQLALGVVIAIVVVAAGLIWANLDDDGTSIVGGTTTTSPDETTTTVDPGATTTTGDPGSPSTTAPATIDPTVMWPFPGSSESFATPAEAARSFALDFLGFSEVVVGDFQQGDTRSGEVPIQPRVPGPVTTVLVRQVGAGTNWSVLGSTTESITVDQPQALSAISSPVSVAGRAHAFEGTVDVDVRQDGQLSALGSGFVTGGGDQMRPFTGSIRFTAPSAARGALVLYTRSAENGQVWEAATVRIEFGGAQPAGCGSYAPPRPTPGPGQMEVIVFFNCGGPSGDVNPVPVYRLVPQTAGVLGASITALLAGPNATEQAAGLSSFFSAQTEGTLLGVNIRDGHAIVDLDDLRPVIPNASTSAGSASLLAQLDSTVFHFGTVDSAEYRLEGSCAAFNEWLQLGGCPPRTRADLPG